MNTINYSKEIFSRVKEILIKNNCSTCQVSLSENKSDDSITILGVAAIHIRINTKGNFFIIPTELAKQVPDCYPVFDIVSNGVRFKFDSLADLDDRFEKIIASLYQILLKRLSVDEFGCCSRYLECSDKKTCVNTLIDNKKRKLSTGCHYKKHLESGHIFYGKNANI